MTIKRPKEGIMASDMIGNVSSSDYSVNYSYLKSTDAKNQQTQDSTVKQQQVDTVKTIEEDKTKTDVKETKNVDSAPKSQETKSIYEEEQAATKKEEERRKQEAEDAARAEYLKQLSDKLNSKVNTLSENIKFGINDKADSIVISVVEQNNEKKVKELSKDQADLLYSRLDYVLGVLFDRKA